MNLVSRVSHALPAVVSLQAKRKRASYVRFILAVFLIFQLPFLKADPHQVSYYGRDAHTDEALNLNQVINWVENGSLDKYEGDNLVKNPLFNAHQALALFAAGNNRETARVMVMIILSLLLLITSLQGRRYAVFIACFILLGLSQYDLFQYFRFSMPELVCALLVITGIAMLTRWFSAEPAERKQSTFLLIHLVFFLAFWEKSQYLYVIGIPAVAFGFYWLSNMNRETFFLLVKSVACTLAFILVFVLCWYLPNREMFSRVMGEMLHQRFAPGGIFWAEVKFNLERAFFAPHESFNTWFFLFSLLAGLCCLKGSGRVFRTGFLLLLCWMVLESHKLAIRWVPTRYLVSTYAMMAATIAWVVPELFRRAWQLQVKMPRFVSMAFLSLAGLALIFFNAANYRRLFTERSYVLYDTQRQMAEVDFKGRPALGSWAPSVTWGAQVRTMPVWKGYLNDTDVISLYKPRLIVTEKDEADANGMYSARGINLVERCDSVQEIKTGRWELRLYWFK